MRIKSVYISAFGALKDKKIELSDGLQVIYGENEAGKTTVTEFIKSMFYGTGRRAAGQLMSIREKYTPLDGAQAGGRVYFEHAGKEYCIERQFRKSDATDKIMLTDIGTGKSEPCASDIGNSLFGITMPAFERSVFIGNTPDIRQDDGAFGEIMLAFDNISRQLRAIKFETISAKNTQFGNIDRKESFCDFVICTSGIRRIIL